MPDRVRLSDARVRVAVCPPGRTEMVILDAEVPALGLRARAGGGKRWTCTYKGQDGRVRRLTSAMPRSSA